MIQINCYLCIFFFSFVSATLYPYDSPSRQIKNLDGLWKFRLSPLNDPDAGFNEAWFLTPFEGPDILDMPVPASYNDITVSSEVRDFIGWAWYQRSFQLTQDWEGKRLLLRFGSVHYTARVFLNGQEVGGHTGGHMAFEIQVSVVTVVKFHSKAWGILYFLTSK